MAQKIIFVFLCILMFLSGCSSTEFSEGIGEIKSEITLEARFESDI